MEHKFVENLTNHVTTLEQNFNNYAASIQKRSKMWEKFDSQYTSFRSKQELIKLNVGGYLFQASLATLTSVKDSLFHSLIDTNSNEIFIDRPGKHFHIILNHLRT